MFARVVCVTVPLGYIALLVILVVAGLKYLTSGGEAKAVASAHQTVTWGLLGILFLAIAWLILQLIQTFTGVEVTKFTLSSLPGVQGFSGQCSTPAPIAPEPTPQPAGVPSATSPSPPPGSTVIPTQPPTVVDQPTCTNSSEIMVPTSAPPTLVAYTNAADLIELANVLSATQFIMFLGGTSDDTVYTYTYTYTYPGAIYPFAYYGGIYYGKYEKGADPSELTEATIQARNVADQILLSQGLPPLPLRVEILHSVTDCPDADFYGIYIFSPLIYLYPTKTTVSSIKIDSPLISPIFKMDKNHYWNIVASPDGTLTTIDGNRYRYIPYEFLRSDFKRPEKGVVIEGGKLEEYLRKDLWQTLGLTDSEIADYWQDTKPRVKPSPYYFVSLIDRSEIDRVLPMEVNPKPDTTIRNMTYILPLSQAPSLSIMPLEEERLKAPERKGFTVLENGVFTDGF